MPKKPKPKNPPSGAKSGVARGNDNDGAQSRKRDASAGAQKTPAHAVTTLAEFIEYAYSRKGQKLALTPAVEKRICKKPVLGKESESRLLELAKADALLAVPRQILLCAQTVIGYPALQSAVTAFTGKALEMHPVFSLPEVKDVFEKIENILDSRGALAALASADYSKLPAPGKAKRLSATNIQALRLNATYALAVWLYAAGCASLETLTRHLFSAMWKPKEGKLRPDEIKSTRLRMLTDIRDPAGVGVACMSFKEQYDEQVGAAESAERKTEMAAKESKKLRQKVAECDTMLAELRRAKSELQQALAAEKENSKNMRVHLLDDMATLRARVLKRLIADASLLGDGLHALRKNPPKTAVMDDHADRVLESLTKEINALNANE